MIPYYLDQEFHERWYKPLFGKKVHIIELISIALVSGDGRSYYAVSKDFDLKAAWKNEWLKENVLRPIWGELFDRRRKQSMDYILRFNITDDDSYQSVKALLAATNSDYIMAGKELRDRVLQLLKGNMPPIDPKIPGQ